MAVLLGAGTGAALWLLITGIRGVVVDPTRPPSHLARSANAMRSPGLSGRILGGIAVAALTLAVTRWPVAALGLGALVIWWPALFGGTTAEQRQIAALEALVTWTETLRDTIAAHASLEQAIPASAVNAPTLIRPALVRLVGQLRARVPLDKALLAFAAELDDPSADLVIAALMLSAKRRGDRLGEVLTGLTTTAREELEMRRKISAGRAELRRGVQIVVVVTVLIGGFLVLFSGAYIAPYGTPAGQLALAVVVGIFAAAFLWMRKLSAQQPVAPFLTRPGQHPDPDETRFADNSSRPSGFGQPGSGPVIAAIGLGALVGGVLFALVLHLARPGPAPLVELARFDAAHTASSRCGSAGRSGRAGPVAGLGAAGRGGGVGGRATDPPRRHPRQPAAGPRPDRPHLRTGHDPEGAVRHRRPAHRAAAAGGCAGRGRCRAADRGATRRRGAAGRRRCSSCPTWKPRRTPPGGGRSSGTPSAPTWIWSRWRWPPGPHPPKPSRRRRRSAPGGRWR